jgi:hypothetical protein
MFNVSGKGVIAFSGNVGYTSCAHCSPTLHTARGFLQRLSQIAAAAENRLSLVVCPFPQNVAPLTPFGSCKDGGIAAQAFQLDCDLE